MSKPRIEGLWAWLYIDDDGSEGVPAIRTPDGWLMPLMGGDEARMRSMQYAAQEIANSTGRPVELCVFLQRQHVATADPDEPEDKK